MNWNKVSLTFLTFALLAHCLPVDAQSPPRPPALVEDNYDLAAALAVVPFNVLLPAEPVITSEAVCTTEAEIMASLAVNGRRTIIAPGSYSFDGITIGGNNKHIVFQPGANFSVSTFSFSNASSVTLENAVLATTGQWGLNVSGSQDVRIVGLVLNAADSAFYAVTNNSRLLLLSSSITAAVTGGATGNISNFIVANSEIISNRPEGTNNGWAMRWWGDSHTNTVFMDSRFRALQNVVLRFEESQTNGYFARNQIEGNNPFRTEGRDWDNPSAYPLNGLWYIDNYAYPLTAGSGGVIVTPYPRTTNLTATGNRTVAPGNTNNVGFASGQATWTLSNNAHIVTNGYQPPPVWEMR